MSIPLEAGADLAHRVEGAHRADHAVFIRTVQGPAHTVFDALTDGDGLAVPAEKGGQLLRREGAGTCGRDADVFVGDRIQDLREIGVVLIPQHTQQQDASLVRKVAPQVLRHGLGALGIVTPVYDEIRLLMQKLKAAGPVRRVEAVLHIGLRKPPAPFAQDLHDLKHCGGVFWAPSSGRA